MAWKLSTWAKRVRLASIATIAFAISSIAIPAITSAPVEAKTPGKTYCFVGKCHRVKTIEETHQLVGVEQNVTASHYDDCSKDRYNPCGLTSSGERFHPDRPDNTASPIYPDGTQLLVWSPKNKRALVLRVNNAGPYWGNRTLDLSRAAAEKLGFEGAGVAALKVKVIKAPELEESRYKKNREYAPVPGDIGQYASLDEAQTGMAVVLAFKATTGSPFAPVTTANAFSGQSVGAGNLLVAEAPQAIGRVMTIAYSPPPVAPVALGGFPTQSHVERSLGQSRTLSQAANQSRWDEDRVIDGPVKLSAVTEAVASETSSITAPKKERAAKEAAKAKLAAAAYEDAKPAKKKRSEKAEKSDASEKSEKAGKSSKTASKSSRRSRRDRDVASYDERRSSRSNYREDREYRPRVAYQGGGNGYSDGGRSAGQTMQDNFRPL